MTEAVPYNDRAEEMSVYVDQELLTLAKGAVMLDEGREVTDELADATGTTPEEIERGAEVVDMELVDIEAVPERQPITWGSEQ